MRRMIADDIVPAAAAQDMAKLRDALRLATLVALRRARVDAGVIAKIEAVLADEPPAQPSSDPYRSPAPGTAQAVLTLTPEEHAELVGKLQAAGLGIRLDALGVRVQLTGPPVD